MNYRSSSANALRPNRTCTIRSPLAALPTFPKSMQPLRRSQLTWTKRPQPKSQIIRVKNRIVAMAIVNITTENDADFNRTFVWQTAALVPINMTGMALEMMLRRHAEDAAAELRLATDTGEIVFVDAVNGKFAVRINQAVLER